MQYEKVGSLELSRLGLGTKRLPQTDVTHVLHVDGDVLREIVHASQEMGMNYVDTSYSAGKGEVEAGLGEDFSETGKRMNVSTSYFEMIDPRYDYVFEKQLKKLQTDCIELYYLEGMNDYSLDNLVESGTVDYLFEQKEAGRIANLGFSSEMGDEKLKDALARYPWDFVRLRINFYDWFQKGARGQYEIAGEKGIPVIAHGALRAGSAARLKPDALEVLREAHPKRSAAEWGLRFVKSLAGVKAVTVNVKSIAELEENARVFEDDEILAQDELALLDEASKLQRIVKRVS